MCLPNHTSNYGCFLGRRNDGHLHAPEFLQLVIGHALTRSWITHAEIVGGGKLVLTMGPTPNRAWGAAQADRPGQALTP